MADYLIAIKPVILIEGGYVNDPNDNGGETYKGISRKFWGQSKVWPIVDASKVLQNFPGNLSSNSDLQNLIISFYKINFWNPIGGDNINNQPIANLLVDSAVNEGISPAIKRAEVIVGLPSTGHISDALINKLNALT
jgi:lysozyme family protein